MLTCMKVRYKNFTMDHPPPFLKHSYFLHCLCCSLEFHFDVPPGPLSCFICGISPLLISVKYSLLKYSTCPYQFAVSQNCVIYSETFLYFNCSLLCLDKFLLIFCQSLSFLVDAKSTKILFQT